jgi:hypothetical protein
MTVKWNEYLIEQFPVTEYAAATLLYFYKQQDISTAMALACILAWHSGCPHCVWALFYWPQEFLISLNSILWIKNLLSFLNSILSTDDVTLEK